MYRQRNYTEYTKYEDRPARFDCGKYGVLTAKEIKDKFGIAQAQSWYYIYKKQMYGEDMIDYLLKHNNEVPYKDRKYNCGKYGELTISQIMKKGNISESAAKFRVRSDKFLKEEIIEGHEKPLEIKYDCGIYGMMSIKEMYENYSMNRLSTYKYRVSKGYTGNALIEGKAKRYDCGIYGRLTAKEISDMTDISQDAVYRRVNDAGLTKEEIITGNPNIKHHKATEWRDKLNDGKQKKS